MYITASNSNIPRYATGFYGYPYSSQKHLTCDVFNDLYPNIISSKRLIFEDFNLMLNSLKRWEGIVKIIIIPNILLILLMLVI